MNTPTRYIMVLTLVLCAGIGETEAAGSESMEVSLNGWYAGLRGDLTVNGYHTHFVQEAGDLFQDLDLGGSLSILARNNKMIWLGSIDYFKSISSEVMVGNQPGTLETEEMIGLLAAGWPLSASGGTSVDFLAGIQILRMDNELKLVGGTTSSSDADLYDPVIILLVRQQLGDRLQIYVPLSIGGYLGDADLLYSAELQLQFQATDRFDVRGGYRVVGYDYEANASNALEYFQAGWVLGVGARF